MELRGQDKVIGMPTTLGYNPPNKDSSSSKLSSPSLPPTHVNNTIFINPPQTLDPHPLPHHQQPQQLNQPPHKSRIRDLDPNPDPISSPIVVTPSPATTKTTPIIASGSNFKAPPAQPPPQPSALSKVIRYRECLKNHAASSGGHVLDGCGEFMPGGEEDTLEALKCAACECHRNFHRKEIEGEHIAPNNYYVINHQKPNSRRDSAARVLPLPPPPPPIHHSSVGGSIPSIMMAFGGGGGGAAESSSDDLNVNNLFRANNYAAGQQATGSKKRFRTKFSQEQKEKMMEVAEKLGWKIQKHDEQEVQKLCSEVGIKRQVFKVWMHNNKQAMKKKQM